MKVGNASSRGLWEQGGILQQDYTIIWCCPRLQWRLLDMWVAIRMQGDPKSLCVDRGESDNSRQRQNFILILF